MSLLAGVLATAFLFGAFGMLHRGRRPRLGCAACPGDACHRDCQQGAAPSESTDATR